MIVRVPWLPDSANTSTNVLAELIDVYPTVAALARVRVIRERRPQLPVHLEAVAAVQQRPVHNIRISLQSR